LILFLLLEYHEIDIKKRHHCYRLCLGKGDDNEQTHQWKYNFSKILWKSRSPFLQLSKRYTPITDAQFTSLGWWIEISIYQGWKRKAQRTSESSFYSSLKQTELFAKYEFLSIVNMSSTYKPILEDLSAWSNNDQSLFLCVHAHTHKCLSLFQITLDKINFIRSQ
jgi:hypothetical protein